MVGGLQGVAELFPVSSLGHGILLPALVGGTWARDLDVSAPESPYLAFVVGLHVATAFALIVFFRRDWARIVRGLLTSVVRREVTDADQRLGWLLVLGTIPVGISGLLLGPGFPPDFLAHAFERFHRAGAARSRDKGGRSWACRSSARSPAPTTARRSRPTAPAEARSWCRSLSHLECGWQRRPDRKSPGGRPARRRCGVRRGERRR